MHSRRPRSGLATGRGLLKKRLPAVWLAARLHGPSKAKGFPEGQLAQPTNEYLHIVCRKVTACCDVTRSVGTHPLATGCPPDIITDNTERSLVVLTAGATWFPGHAMTSINSQRRVKYSGGRIATVNVMSSRSPSAYVPRHPGVGPWVHPPTV
ncbi:hypothetical protein RR46_12358 [Papilio xuthus]|uniref:Uncharacterized protein n=1 Tax=Papilio xuthus TaxID=66420 RepID=A0A194PTM6_PAPXU|nr:hypothetical protein RR46_12358 [Papilio xuthus]